MGLLRDLAKAEKVVEQALIAWAPTLRALGGEVPAVRSIIEQLRPLAERIVPLLADTSRMVVRRDPGQAERAARGRAGHAARHRSRHLPVRDLVVRVGGRRGAGAGIGPTRIDAVIGITKAYATRVGEGPFPTELHDATGDKLRDDGAEFGSVTGRPRRTGWLDLPALRYAARVNGLDGLALTKLDVLTGHPELKVCVAYDTPAGRTDEVPIDMLDEPGQVKPVYETFRGWTESLAGVRSSTISRPRRATTCASSSKSQGVPICLVSVGPRRSETVVIKNPFAP